VRIKDKNAETKPGESSDLYDGNKRSKNRIKIYLITIYNR